MRWPDEPGQPVPGSGCIVTIARCYACAAILYWVTALAIFWKPFDPAVISLVELGRLIQVARLNQREVQNEL